MGNAADHLPAPFKDEEISVLLHSISLGRPISIRPLKVTAAFHIIYVLTYDSKTILPKLPETATKPTTSTFDLILRIAGGHIPCVKTENEAAVLSWVRQHTSVPVPNVVAYDATTANPLNREFIIFNRCPGVTISDIYDSLTQPQLDSILKQLIHILTELHSHPFTSIGGLTHSPDDPKIIIPGPILDEWFWFVPDIKTHFPPTETYTSLNITGPFPSYTSYTAALIEKYIHIARIHPSLTFLGPLLPRLSAFISNLPTHAAVLNNTPIRLARAYSSAWLEKSSAWLEKRKLRDLAGKTFSNHAELYPGLAHKDLHFANILYDPTTGLITAILDWEFSGTVPFPLWDPPRAFLWNGRDGEEAYKEKYRLRDRFAELCREEGVEYLLKDAEFTSELQEKMYTIANMMRWFVTFIPKGQFLDRTEGWMGDLARELEGFGV